MSKDLLPIGSVVSLNGGEKRLMIFGIVQSDPATGKQYDYLACLYPEGFVGPEQTFLFNHDDIQKVSCEGFADAEHQEFRDDLALLLKEMAASGADDL